MSGFAALLLLLTGFALIVAGVTWLFGPYGLIGSGVVLLAVVLTVVEVNTDREQEPTEGP